MWLWQCVNDCFHFYGNFSSIHCSFWCQAATPAAIQHPWTLQTWKKPCWYLSKAMIHLRFVDHMVHVCQIKKFGCAQGFLLDLVGHPMFSHGSPILLPGHSQVTPRSLPGHSQIWALPPPGYTQLFLTKTQLTPRSLPGHSQVTPRFGESLLDEIYHVC